MASATAAAAAPKQVRVGVAVFVYNQDGEFVLGLRKGSHGAGKWALPGGHLEFGESFEECASREVLEETGIDITKIKYLTATNDYMQAEGKHYVTVFVTARAVAGRPEAQLLEPNKCERWEWKRYGDLRGLAEDAGGLFLPMVNLLEQRADLRPEENM